eukprot:scaffold142272_cov33-Prasinocladus_malaysianus.AAC.1
MDRKDINKLIGIHTLAIPPTLVGLQRHPDDRHSSRGLGAWVCDWVDLEEDNGAQRTQAVAASDQAKRI